MSDSDSVPTSQKLTTQPPVSAASSLAFQEAKEIYNMDEVDTSELSEHDGDEQPDETRDDTPEDTHDEAVVQTKPDPEAKTNAGTEEPTRQLKYSIYSITNEDEDRKQAQTQRTQAMTLKQPRQDTERIHDLRNAFDRAKQIFNADREDEFERENEQQGSTKIPANLLCLELDRRRTKVKLCKELFFFSIYFCIYIVGLMFMQQSTLGFSVQKAVEDQIVTQTVTIGNQEVSFYDIADLGQFYAWFDGVWIAQLYTNTWYSAPNDTLGSDLLHMINYQTKLVGGFRLEQTRGKIEYGLYCEGPEYDFVPSCKAKSKYRQDMDCNDRLICNSSIPAFQYRTVAGASGFFHDFVFNDTDNDDLTAALVVSSQLKMNRWLDEQTRSIRILSNLYNNNYKRWVLSKLNLKLDLSGNFIGSADIRAVHIIMFDMTSTIGVIVFVLQILYVLILIFFAARLIRSLHYHRLKPSVHFRRAWLQWIFLFINMWIIISYFAVVANKQRQKMLKLSSTEQHYGVYRDLSNLAKVQKHFETANAINLVVATLTGLSFFQVMDSGEAVFVALSSALPLFLSYMPMYFFAIIGFSLAGYVLFGLEHESFSTFENSFLSVIETNFGIFDSYGTIVNGSEIVGKIYMVLMLFLFVTFLFNIFLAIVIDSWDTFLELRKQLQGKQKFGIRRISLKETVYCWLRPIPLNSIRRAIRIRCQQMQMDHVYRNEIFVICQQLEIEHKYACKVADLFWPGSYQEFIQKDQMFLLDRKQTVDVQHAYGGGTDEFGGTATVQMQRLSDMGGQGANVHSREDEDSL